MANTKKNTKSTKKKETETRVTRSSSKKGSWNQPIVYIIGGLLLLGIVSYFLIGIFFTIILIVGIAAILGVAHLLDKVKTKKKQRRIINIILIFCLSIGILGALGIGGFLAYVVKTAPDFNPTLLSKKEASILYDMNGNEIVKMGTEMRENITYDQLPQVLIDAIIATEDSRFFQHNGFDAPRFMVASVKQALRQGDAGGASTLSMQVIKNTLTGSEDQGLEGITRKFQDIYLSIFKLEKNYTKEQIIEFYVNNHFLGGSAWGVEQASQSYFGKSVTDLNLSEAAIIAGMFKSPNYYRPTVFPERAESRRNTVLYLMQKHGYITKEEADLASSIPVESLLNPKKENASEFQGFIDTVVEELDEKYNLNPYVTPVLIYTTMDRDKQVAVNKVQNGDTFKWKNDVIQSGAAVLDVHSGKLLAIGAGRNREGLNSFNFATLKGGIKRQPGSSAKPLFDYGPGLEYNNWSTYTLFNDEPYSYSSGQNLNNWDGKYFGTMTLRQALAASRNVPALKAFQQVDNKKIVSFVQSLGISPEVAGGKVHEAHAVGAFNGVTPIEMAAAYAAFANGGYYYEPYTVSKIVYRGTDKVVEHTSEKKQAMSDSTAYLITDILLDATAASARVNGVNIAAKTGTTNFDAKVVQSLGLASDAVNDSWTIGYNPDIVIGMWYGYNTPTKEYYNRNTDAAINRDKLFHAYANGVFPKDNKKFSVPNSVVEVPIEMGTNPPLLASATTPQDQITYEYFKKGTEPTETSDKYSKLDTPGSLQANYVESTEKVNLTWNKVTPTDSKSEYGDFGYYVYFNGKEIGFTTKNTYTISNPTTPYGTYKVVASFEKYIKNQSDPATVVLKKQEVDDPTITSELLKKTINLTVGTPYTAPNGTAAVKVMEDGKDVTSLATITYTIENFKGETVGSIDTSKADIYTIVYTVTYKKYTKTLRMSVVINNP